MRPAGETPSPEMSTKIGLLCHIGSGKRPESWPKQHLQMKNKEVSKAACATGCVTFSARAQGMSSWEAEQFTDLLLPLDLEFVFSYGCSLQRTS